MCCETAINTPMTNLNNVNDPKHYITAGHSGGQLSQKAEITNKDFKRLLTAIEQENVKQKATLLVSLYPYIDKKYQPYRTIAQILGVSSSSIMDWIRIGTHYKFVSSKSKGGEK